MPVEQNMVMDMDTVMDMVIPLITIIILMKILIRHYGKDFLDQPEKQNYNFNSALRNFPV